MRVIDVSENLSGFIEYVSSKKKNLSNWHFLHVVVQSSDEEVDLGEVEQFLDFHIADEHAYLLKMTSSSEFLMFLNKDKSKGLTLSRFEKAVQEDFPVNALRIQFRGFDGDGLDQFSRIIARHLDPDNVIDNVLFTRMSRKSNSIFVLDDDPIVLKQIEKILFGFGHVVTMEDAEGFLESYKQYAPDVLFLDIHLRTAMGNELLKELKEKVDPFAHVVMISSDTHENMIVDVKQAGANGFVVKPLDRSKLYQKLVRAPTIITKTSQSKFG